jgi:hypothetical protein
MPFLEVLTIWLLIKSLLRIFINLNYACHRAIARKNLEKINLAN